MVLNVDLLKLNVSENLTLDNRNDGSDLYQTHVHLQPHRWQIAQEQRLTGCSIQEASCSYSKSAEFTITPIAVVWTDTIPADKEIEATLIWSRTRPESISDPIIANNELSSALNAVSAAPAALIGSGPVISSRTIEKLEYSTARDVLSDVRLAISDGTSVMLSESIVVVSSAVRLTELNDDSLLVGESSRLIADLN